MCHRSWREHEWRFEEERDERLWELFHRETRENPPPMPVAKGDDERVEKVDRTEAPAGVDR